MVWRRYIGLLSIKYQDSKMNTILKSFDPAYITQALTGLVGMVAILIGDEITKWHIFIAVVIGISLITSLLVTARAKAESVTNKKHVETLLRAMELPYFIIKELTPVISSIARAKGWTLTRQENFKNKTVYEFQSNKNEHGRLVISDQEFKDLWILESNDCYKAIENNIFDLNSSNEESLSFVIRQAISERISGEFRVKVKIEPDGTKIFHVTKEGSDIAAIQFSADHLHELASMIPLRRYQAAAEKVWDVLKG